MFIKFIYLYRIYSICDTTVYESAILIKVDKKTKKKMEEVKINWSEEIRKFIKTRIESEGSKNVALAVAMTSKLFRRAKAKGFDTTSTIRKFRDERYGPNSS